MNFTKNLLLACSVVLSADTIFAQSSPLAFDFPATSFGNYRQNPSNVAFEGGSFRFDARDGNFIWTGPPCEDRDFYLPSPVCPLGATGYVSRGLENDPLLRGLGPYFSVTELAAAQILAPFAPSSAILVAAPPSLLPRPSGGFIDKSISVFYNLQTPFIKQYPIAFYEFSRSYSASERRLFDGEVVPGTYQYNFARLPDPLRPLAFQPPVVISINNFPKLDGYRKINSQPQGVRFLNVTYDDGFALLNPFELNTLTWEGNTINFIAPTLDTLFFSIKALTDPTDPLSDPAPGIPLFPNFVAIDQTRVILPNALQTTFVLAPNFLDPGETGLIDLEFEIYRPTTNVIYERAVRRFRLPVRVLNPFLDSLKSSLPPGATSTQLAADFDFDGDGFSNFTEWAFGSDPSKASSVPGAPDVKVVATAAPAAGTFEVVPGSESALEFKVAKLQNTIPKLKYAIEYSENMKDWTQIVAGNPAWALTETYNEIKVTGIGANPNPGGFFRTKVVALP